MLDMCRKIADRAEGLTPDQFDADENLRLALLHLVQVIGEAERCVSSEGRAAHPETPWREITGMRHRIVHDYMHIDDAVLWEVVTKNIPPLLATLERLAPPEEL
jgi:uncharacterized protein with HEPN domain